jgi:endonuclease YncB( thermonuclease family)
MRFWLLSVAMLVTGAACGESLTGRVVGITDGDTITVLVERQQLKVQLANIDAPESRQAFGARSRQALSDLCFQKDARLETQGQDLSGRRIATVFCAGRDAGAEQVWQGMAWVLDRYARPDSPLYLLQAQAKAARRGLWSDPNPTPPWKWRGVERDTKSVAPSEVGSNAAMERRSQAAPRRWVCDRKEVPRQNEAVVECGWR